MSERIWVANAVGDWFHVDNWTTAGPDPNDFPQPGDTAVIAAGTASIAAHGGAPPTVEDLQVTLGGGGNTGEAVRLRAVEASISDTTFTVASGADGWITPVEADFRAIGATTLQGRFLVEAQRGGLTITVQDAPGGTAGVLHLADTSGSGGDSLIAVAQQSTLTLRGGSIVNDGFVQVEGFARVTADTTIAGAGVIEVENGGRMRINGAVGDGQRVILPDGLSSLVIGDPTAFAGRIGLSTVGGNRIDLRDLDAASFGVADGRITFYAGPGQTGPELASFAVSLINPADLTELPASQQTLSAADFTLRDLEDGGTRLLYTPQGPTYLTTSLPVPVIAAAGTLVDLSTMFEQAFGTATPGFTGMTLLPINTYATFEGFWGQPVNGGHEEVPAWWVNGAPVLLPYTVQPGDLVQLQAGNNINNPPQIQVQLTPAASGADAVFLTYDIWTVAPEVAQVDPAAGTPSPPTPDVIVAAANAYASFYGDVLNDNLCNWIADNVAAAAGGTMPFQNASLSPDLNIEGGFWRIAYRASDADPPVSDWGTLVLPGDIVRIQWTSQSGHTTTVLGAVNASGEITVYDNVNMVNGQHTIGIHDAAYWHASTPFGITIYRLADDQRYLIDGTEKGEFVQGSVYDDLIRPHGGGDTIATGPGEDLIEGQVRDLRGATLADLAPGDAIDLTDLDPATASVSLHGDKLLVLSGGQRVATIDLAAPVSGSFAVTADGSGGTLISLQPPPPDTDTVLI